MNRALFVFEGIKIIPRLPGPALADAGPNAKPRRGAPLSSNFMTSSCSVNSVTFVVEHRYPVQH